MRKTETRNGHTSETIVVPVEYKLYLLEVFDEYMDEWAENNGFPRTKDERQQLIRNLRTVNKYWKKALYFLIATCGLALSNFFIIHILPK